LLSEHPPDASALPSYRKLNVYLGQAGLRTWATVLILADAGIDRPLELIVTSVVRGRFCELAGRAIGLESRRHDLSFLGLFSLIDAILRRPMHEALQELPLPPDVAAAIRGEPNGLGELLSLARAYERADWPVVEHLVRRLGVAATEVSTIYLEAVAWGSQTGHLR
jgi:c-di-GMP-related signal transduction protein